MTDKLQRRQLRKQFSPLGWALLIYLLILNAAVYLSLMVEMLALSIREMNGELFTDEQRTAILMNNGWGYLAAIAIGVILLRVWQGKAFFSKTLWTRGRPMTVPAFLCLVCVFLSGQLAFSILAGIQESILNQFGLSAMSSIESATMSVESLSMFLYAGIGAPIAEEILFRGLVLRKLEPYGKRFAIILSAFCFAVYHGNIVQIPYAFLVGLVLGYVAVEHNILWAMVLHMINNLVLADMLPRLLSGLGAEAASGILGMIILVCSVAGMVILIVNWSDVSRYRRENRVSDPHAAAFLTCPGVIALIVYALFTVASPLISQIVENMAGAA